MSKKIRPFLGIGIAGFFILAGCGEESNSAQETEGEQYPETVRFAYTTVPSMLAVAIERDMFDEEFADEDIEFEFDQFLSGPPLIEAFSGGRLDFGQVGDQPAVQARANDIGIKAVGTYLSSEERIGLVVPEDSEASDISDLQGKKIGVTVGSVGHKLLNEYLEFHGLDSGDVEQINLQPPEIQTTLREGNIDGAVTYDPWIAIIEEEGFGKQVDDAAGILNNYSFYIASDEFAEEYPDATTRIVKVLHEATEWAEENPEEAIEYMASVFNLEHSIMERSFERGDYSIEMSEDAFENVTNTEEGLREAGDIRQEVDIEELLDTQYLEKLGIQ